MVAFIDRWMTRAILDGQRPPSSLRDGKHPWDGRFDDIAAFERYFGRSGTPVLKFILQVGRDEQKRRFLDRLDEPDKTWKFSPSDFGERERWDDDIAPYEAAIAATATEAAPRFVVPADHRWLIRLIVVEAVVAALHLTSARQASRGPARRGKREAEKLSRR